MSTSVENRSRRFSYLIAMILVLLLAIPGAAQAKKEKKKKRQFTVSTTIGKKLARAQEAMAEEQWAVAIEALESSRLKADAGRLTPHERALIYQFYSLIVAAEGKYPESLEFMKKCLDQDALPDPTQLSMMFNVAQIHLALEQYPEAAKALERWFENTNEPNSHAYYLLAVAYYQQSEHEKALEPAKKAVEIAKKPNQSWLQMLVGLYLEQERFADALPHVEVLVTHFPRKNYYTQLSALYAQLELEEKSLAIMQLAYQQGFLTLDRELRRLGEMYLYHGLPQRAAGLMEKAFDEEKVEVDAKSLELLGNSFLMARDLDKAVDPLSRAAELSEEGEIYIRLGQIFLEREDWNAAADALSKGIERGVKKEGDAQLLLGIAYYNQNESKNAWRAFRAAREFEKSKVSALRWIEMLERDEARAAELDEFS